jgi:hypothetical protein
MLSGGPLEAGESTGLQLRVRDTYLPGTPLLVRVQLHDSAGRVDRSRWDGTVTIAADNPDIALSTQQIELVNGLGSALIHVQGNGDFQLTASIDAFQASKPIRSVAGSGVTDVSGLLDAPTTTWSGIVHVTGDVTVPDGSQLIVQPGTLVLVDGATVSQQLNPGRKIIVQGVLQSNGTEAQPVTFTAWESDRPWGEFDVEGGELNLAHTEITRSGNSPRGGHTGSGPAIRLGDDGKVMMTSTSITDIRGKIMQASSGEVRVHDSLFSRAVMGPEIDDTALHFTDSWIIEMAGAYHHNGTVNDNDGIYLHSQAMGQDITLSGGVVAKTQDDGIDTLRSEVSVSNFIVRNTGDKATSIFSGNAELDHVLIADSDIGISAKGMGNDQFHVAIDRSTIVSVLTAIQAEDKDEPDPNVKVTYDVTNSIVQVKPGGVAVATDYDPNDIHINYSILPALWQHDGSGTGNLVADPGFVSAENHDFRLTENSAAVDTGDPTAEPDPDGTRADRGAIPFSHSSTIGDFDRNGIVDSHDVDLLCKAIANMDQQEHFDVDSNGSIEFRDMEVLIENILETSFGDANLDGRFDSSDLVRIFQSGEYEDAAQGNSTWQTGDWNCDGEFSTADLVLAFQKGGYTAQ